MSENLPEGIYYPSAIKNHGGKMRVRGSYSQGFPLGAIVHSTDGRPNDGSKSAADGVAEGKYAYFVIGRSGNIYQNFSLQFWGEHAGPTLHPQLGNKLSTKLVGIEMVSAGILKKIDNNTFRPWYNDKPTRNTPKPSDDFKADDVRFREAIGSRSEFGYQTAGHYLKFTETQETALIKLLRWMHQQRPQIFKFENVLGHDEVAIDEDRRYGRKEDPGAGLSMPMAAFRLHLKED